MDINIVNECTSLSLEGKATFPEIVMKLAAAGVERYIIDLVGLQKLTYGEDNTFHMDAFPFPDADEVVKVFDTEAIKATIKDVQQQKINYQTFLYRIIAAGCCHYEVYIHGKKAIYFGRDGSQHIENFPSQS